MRTCPSIKRHFSNHPANHRATNANQEDYFAAHPEERLKDKFLLIGSSDSFVSAYRKWLDRVGPEGMPWFQGLATSKGFVHGGLGWEAAGPVSKAWPLELAPSLNPAAHRSAGYLETRYHRHVLHCTATRTALGRIRRTKHAALALAAAAVSAVVLGSAAQAPHALAFRFLAPAVLALAGAATGLHLLEKEFYVSFKRREELRHKRRV
jgi:hypothetical protein